MNAPEYLPAARRWPERRAATEAEAKALASSVRLRILRMCLDRELTNKEIAERLDANPATVLHHVRTLVDTGFLEARPPRRGKRGSREVPYLATGKSWAMDEHRSTPAMIEAFVDELRGVDLTQDALFTRLGLRLTPEQHRDLRDRLHEVIMHFAELPLAPEGRPYSVFVAVHEDPSRDQPA
ncbi:winged helix-turn-helix domain-containing protein [Virgisporangium ochraceum]|uniref:ArsR family transcriptional regulator n=1 Tax=Virgisporangium ochraceum TaxID=65505 RepID=A0A8J3ZPC9_9ACTN|nr:winged helix-turn-helix domain-containing protein [Virgisporangium ochraceum]GIJ66592.1 ArsR family transcriptional regulator [Virgisporangium ochraceum]